MEKMIEVKDLSVEYHTYAGIVQAVRNISFQIDKEETVAIVGESGCGKSVTAKSIMGLIEKPGKISERSQILFDGVDLTANSEKEWNLFRGRKCSMILQDALVSLNPTMNVGKQIIENLENHYKMYSREMYKKAEEMLHMVGIPDPHKCLKKFPHELSGGMRQRVMIAIALIAKPELLIADEPTTALDVTIQAQIIRLMKELQKKIKMSVILITHDLGVVADIADRILVMYAGKIVESGTCREIFFDPRHPYTWALLKSIPNMESDMKQPLVTIEGNIPDMSNPPTGCAFYNRCPYAMNICETEQPKQKHLENGHHAACWLLDPRADRTGVPFETGGEWNE